MQRRRSTCERRVTPAQCCPPGLPPEDDAPGWQDEPATTWGLGRPETTELHAELRAKLLAFAALNAVPVQLLYRKPGAVSAEIRTVTPQEVTESRRGAPCLIAHDHVRGERRTFRLSRIEGVLL